METKKYICLDIGGTKLLAVLFDGTEIVCKVKKKTKSFEGVDKLKEKIISLVNEVLKLSELSISDISAISAGAAGIVDEDKGIIIYSPNLPWENYDIKKDIVEKFHVPFYIGNDVNVGVLGEWKFGSGKNAKNLLGIFVGTGIGGGLVINNMLYTGNKHAAGEIGHISVNTEGPYCNCGQRGCVEAYASKTAMLRDIKYEILRGRHTILEKFLNGNYNTLKSKYIKQGIEENDSLSIEILERAMYYLAAGAGGVINTLDPEKVILGGGLIEATGDYAIRIFKKYLEKFTMVNIMKNVEISKSVLGDYAVIYGSRALIDLKNG
ncbi:MAG: ROK family protein [Clostridiales bacterium]